MRPFCRRADVGLKSQPPSWSRRTLAGGWLLGFVVAAARADVGPPVKITMPPDSPTAAAGQAYDGVFEIQLGHGGVVSEFRIEGEGWAVQSLDRSQEGQFAAPGVLRVAFSAVPADPDKPIRFSLRFDGRTVSRSLKLGPEMSARRARGLPVAQLARGHVAGGAEPRPRSQDGSITVQFKGRIVYERPRRMQNDIPIWFGATLEGADSIWVEVMDEDDGFDEAIWSGYTNADGTFDSGPIQWDDCDVVGCDDPDIYLRWECDTPIVNVQDGEDILEADYSWSTEEAFLIENFTGGLVEFGTWGPGSQQQMAPIHIHNSFVRAFRYIREKSGTNIHVEELDVLWPDSDNAFYDSFLEEIHIGHVRTWNEGTHVHEYGHHFLENYSVNTVPGYCNGWCDASEPFDCGHCMWCVENEEDAWNEGWPHWLADIVTSDYPKSYRFSDGSPYEALIPRPMESLDGCDKDNFVRHHPMATEGFVAALLRDISDDNHDEHDNDGDGVIDIDGTPDCLSLGAHQIFNVVTFHEPETVIEFLTAFVDMYPQHTPRLWSTVWNIHPSYVSSGIFPPDTQPPGAVKVLNSASHPLGEGGPLPCITVHWEAPPDDVSGACSYSYEWTTDPAGAEPDKILELDAIGSCPTVTGGPFDFGDYYISVRAKDCANQWSNEWATFGPFTITECNNNGIIDVCEIACDASLLADPARTTSVPCAPLALPCTPPAGFCATLYPGACGKATDCNSNLVPDSCDLAGGASPDCDESGVPDECEQPFAHWIGGDGTWDDAFKWVLVLPTQEDRACQEPPLDGVVPSVGFHVCIDREPDVTVTCTGGPISIDRLACRDHLALSGAQPTLSIQEPSIVRGDLSLSGSTQTTLNNQAQLTVGGKLVLSATGSSGSFLNRLIGPGPIELEGGLELTANTTIDRKTVNLGNFSRANATRAIELSSFAVFQVRPGSTYDFQFEGGPGGAGSVFSGVNGTFANQGSFVRSVGSDEAHITCRVENSGEIRVQQGRLRLGRGSSNTGSFVGEPGTVLRFQGGQHTFENSSSIVAPDVEFTAGISGENHIHGTYNVSHSSSIAGQALWFHPDANVIDYGDHLTVAGNVHFDHVANKTLSFESIHIDGGNAFLNNTDPVQTQTLTHRGTLRGATTITVSGMTTLMNVFHFFDGITVNANGGLLVVPSSSSRNVDGGSVFNNAGYATFQGGIGCRSNGKFNNLASGTVDITVDGNIITRESALPTDNAGRIVKTAGTGTSVIQVDVNNTGIVEVQTGELEFGRFYIQTDGQTFLNGGNLRKTATSPSNKKPAQIQGGVLRGAGTVFGDVEVAVCNPGPCTAAVLPGGSIGTLNIAEDYTHGAGGALKIEIGGLIAGSEHDQLTVAGAAALQGGELQIAPAGGFIPQVGQQFVVLTASSVQGTFSTVTGPGNYEVTYNPTNVVVTVTAAPCAGFAGPDFDLDCDVDGDDLAAFQACFAGPEIPPPSGCEAMDLDGDLDVDLVDFGLWQACFSGAGAPADPTCGD